MEYVIALDIGGTKIEGAIISQKGAISHTKKIYLHKNDDKNKILSHILYVAQFLKHVTSYPIKGIGISFSGIINSKGVLISQGNKLDVLNGINIKSVIQKKVNLPVFIENDANCFALAESIYGKYKDAKSILGVIWGTSIGSGLIINKQIFEGAQGGAGEIGRIKVPLYLNNKQKNHYQIGHICGGKYIEHTYSKDLDASKILVSKDAEAKKISKVAISAFAWVLSSVVNTLNPEVIVLGGGVSNVPKSVYTLIKKEMKKYCDPYLYKSLKLEKYSLRNDAGLLGAAYLAYKYT